MSNKILSLIGRASSLINSDLITHEEEINKEIGCSRFLVIGGAGSIGQAVTKQIFKRGALSLHVVDINENGLAELVRDIRSSSGYLTKDFQTFCIDVADKEFDLLMQQNSPYDYILNLSAMKHVRSERDVFTLYRMIRVNILNALKILRLAEKLGSKKYFCVSTDKAANPVNIMGATKRAMEILLFSERGKVPISMARFANVAFSSGSLLDGFVNRFSKNQPISAPKDILRYFITPEEAGELCLLSCLLGKHGDIFFPKLTDDLVLTSFVDVCVRYLKLQGFDVYLSSSEEDARSNMKRIQSEKKWPCYFFESNTTGEKPHEEFYTLDEVVMLDLFESIGVIKHPVVTSSFELTKFEEDFQDHSRGCMYSKDEIVQILKKIIPNFSHVELGKSLDQRM